MKTIPHNKFIFLIPLLLFLLSFQQQNSKLNKDIDHSSITVISFNIRYNNPADGPNAWPNRKEKVAGLIKFHKVDLAGLQEVLIGQKNDLIHLLPDYGWIGVGRNDGKEKGEFVPIIYQKKRFELLEEGTIWLSETPQIPSKGWDAALNRIVSWGKFKDKYTAKAFYFFNTHFDHIGVTAREESARLLINEIHKIAGKIPVVLSGDFNFESSEIPYQILTNTANPSGIMDAQFITDQPHYGPVSTFGGGFDEACKTGKKIDYIFVKNDISVIRHGVITDSWAGICPSDHMPVLVEVSIQ